MNLETIYSWINKGALVEKLFNSKSTTYKMLELSKNNLTHEDKISWMAKENLLIKRPVVEYENNIIVGYNENEFLKAFTNK